MPAGSDRNDLTQGPIGPRLVLFALPLLLGTVIQQLYNTVDLIFAGNLIHADAAAAIGASSLLATCLVGFFGGMSVGAGVIIARAYGRRDARALRTAIHSTAALALLGGLGLLLLGEALAPLYLRLLRTPEALMAMARRYLRIYFLSMPAIVVYNLGAGVLRSLGDSRSTLYAQAAGGLANVLFDWLLIRALPDGVSAVAWATMASQGAAAAIVAVRLARLKGEWALRPRAIRLDRSVLRETLRVGVPAGLQAMVITLSNVAAQYHINSLGKDAAAAFTGYFKVELVVYQPIVMLGHAVMAFTGQNLGAGRPDRARRGALIGIAIALGTTVVTSALALLFGRSLFRVFYREEAVIALGLRIIRVSFPFYFLYCFLQLPGDSMRGAGESRAPMRIVLANICLVRTALLFLLVPRWPDVRTVAMCYPITWALTSFCMILRFRRFWRECPAGENA